VPDYSRGLALLADVAFSRAPWLADLGHPCWAIGTVREAAAESERVVLA
jgi:hypothetical protein